MLAFLLPLALTGCDLYNLDDDTGGTFGACPVEVELTVAELPCFCDDELVNYTQGEVCTCTAEGELDCLSEFDTGMYGRLAPLAAPAGPRVR